MTPKQRRLVLAIAILSVLVFAAVVPFEQSVTGPARVEAAVVWYLSSPAADEVITGWRRNLLHASGDQLNMQFERPDFVHIQLADGLAEGTVVSEGDTVAWIQSREGAGNVAVLEAEVEQARRMLTALEAGSREQDVELARRELQRANVALDTANVALTRATELHDSGYVSLAELQQAQGVVNVLKAEVDVAEANLRAYRAGSREQDISVGQAEVQRLDRELDRARSLPGFREPVLTPISGRAHLSDSSGSLLTVEKLDTVAVIALYPETAVPVIEKGDKMFVQAIAGVQVKKQAIVFSLEYAQGSTRGAFAVGLAANEDGGLRPGMTGSASCSIGKRTLLSGALMKLGSRGF